MASDQTFNLPSVRADIVLAGLRSYAALSNRGNLPVRVEANMHIGTVDSEFLVASNLLRKVDEAYMPTQLALDYTREFIWKQDAATSILQPALVSSWYGKEIFSILLERRYATWAQLEEWLLFQCGRDESDRGKASSVLTLLYMCKIIRNAFNKKYTLAPGLEPYLPEAPPDPTRELLIKISTLDEDSKSKVRAFVDDLVRQQA